MLASCERVFLFAPLVNDENSSLRYQYDPASCSERGIARKRSITPYPFKIWRKYFYTGEMPKLLSTFWNEENGQDMVEYTLLLGFVALTGAAVLTDLRAQTVTIWQAISAGFSSAAAGSVS
jgi:Flp pilus assembly pilin Flp